MNEHEFRQWVIEKIAEGVTEDELGDWNATQSFADAGVMSGNEGIVVSLEDGSEFQMTIVQSAYANETEEVAS